MSKKIKARKNITGMKCRQNALIVVFIKLATKRKKGGPDNKGKEDSIKSPSSGRAFG
ncbi:MAG: hypothetical protein ACI9DJ_001452 [Algoriphagus sp.]